MALDQDAARKVLTLIDRDELAQLGCDLTSIPSPTGQEKTIADVRTTQIAVGTAPEEVIVFGGKAYVSNRGSDSVSVIDLATQAVTATITVGDEPFGLAAGAFTTGNYLFVTNFVSNTISIIDVASDTVVKTYP